MKLKLGPVTTEYAGTARLQDVDEDERVASFHVQAREARGQGSAAAVITGRLVPEGDSTRVAVETDLQVTGRQAQLGRGMMEDVAGAVLGEFSSRLEREMRGETPPPAGDEALDVGGAALVPIAQRALPVLVALLIGFLLGRRS
jgi:hypothetical protein